MKKRAVSLEAKAAAGLCSASLLLYLVHYACFGDVPYLWLSVLTNLAFLPISVLVVTLIIDRLLSARERAMRREKLRMLISVFFSSLGNELLAILFRCDASVYGPRGRTGPAERWAAPRPGRVNVVVACRCHEVHVEQADLEQLRSLLMRKLDILLRLLENPSLHEHETFAELLRAVFHLEEETLVEGRPPSNLGGRPRTSRQRREPLLRAAGAGVGRLSGLP